MPLLAKHGNVMESPEVVAALADCEILNNEPPMGAVPQRWARLELVHNPTFRRVSLEVGRKGEIATHRIDYTLRKDGSVYKHYAPYL